jgi:hypothetical protein
VRRRRGAAVGAAALATAAAVAVATVGSPGGSDRTGPADRPPRPDAPTTALADAMPAVEGRDYDLLTSYTNDDLDADNGQYLDGVTDDGLVLFRDGPRTGRLQARFALLDPATGHKDWLPALDIGNRQTWPLELGADRLVLLGVDSGSTPYAYVFDRTTRQWSGMKWRGLPDLDFPRAVMGPDDRLYFFVPAHHGRPPEGGWPVGPDGEADDADAEGDTYHLWSGSLTSTDARDEAMVVGDVAFTDTSMVWTDATNGDPGLVHVRDLGTGVERTFDPRTGERCNLLGFGATGDRIVMSEYCGTYAGGVRDDRVQVLSTDGDQVVTIQGDGIGGSLSPGSDVVDVSSYAGSDAGTYVYDLRSGRFLRVSHAVSKFALGGLASGDRFLWDTPVNHRHGATQSVGELVR